MKPFCAAVLLAASIAGLLPPAHADKIDNLLHREMSSHRIPGAALKIIQRGVVGTWHDGAPTWTRRTF